MYRKYFQMGQLIKTFISTNQSVIVKNECVFHLQKRWAGHSKWQNIKSTKDLMDKNRSSRFSRLSRLITAAVKKSGEDVSQNPDLKKLVEEAQRANMPKATIQKAIALAKVQSGDRPYWVVYSGPRGLVLGLEVIFANRNLDFLRSKLNQTKKLNLKMEVPLDNVCSEKGLIIVDLAENAEKSYEEALGDGIEIGVNEVHESEDNSLIFECLPDRVESVSQQLMKKGYTIHSATTELEFNSTANLSENEIQELESFISKLQSQHEEILRASYNTEGQ